MTKPMPFAATPETDALFKGLSRSTRTFVAIDGANLDFTDNELKINIDYQLMSSMLYHYLDISSINYFTAKPSEDAKNRHGATQFHTFLEFNGYRVHCKPSSLVDNERGLHNNKTNVDVDLAVETMLGIMSDRSIGQFILFSGDSDFISLLRAIRPMARSVVVSTERTQRPHLSRNLRKAADDFIEFADLGPFIRRIRPTAKPEGLIHGSSAPTTAPGTQNERAGDTV